MEALKDVEKIFTNANCNKIRRSVSYEVILAFRNKKSKGRKIVAVDDAEEVAWIASHIKDDHRGR